MINIVSSIIYFPFGNRFHPPDPFYRFKYSEQTGQYTLEMLEDIPVRYSSKTSVHLIETKNKTKVPIFYLQFPQAKYTILYSHGNATDCGGMLPLYELLAMALKVNVVAYDYTGYGVSKHFDIAPTEKQTYQDIETVYQWILDQKIVKDASKELILYGQSVGSGPSCYLASLKQKPIAGLILHSPIMSGLRVLTESRVLGCFDIFPNIDRIGKVLAPVMILHGEADEEVPVTHGKRLHAAGMFSPTLLSYALCEFNRDVVMYQ